MSKSRYMDWMFYQMTCEILFSTDGLWVDPKKLGWFGGVFCPVALGQFSTTILLRTGMIYKSSFLSIQHLQ